MTPLEGSQVATLIPRETIFGNPTRISPRLSPDGTKLAYIAPADGVLNVWVRTVGADDDKVVTGDRGRGIREFGWAYDGRHILYAQDRDGDENWHLWSVDLQYEGVVRDLTPFQGVQAGLLESLPERPDELLVTMNLLDRRYRDVYRVVLSSGAIERIAGNEGATVGWYPDGELEIRGRIDALEDGGFALHVRKSVSGPWREIARWPFGENGSCLGFSPSGESLYLIDSRGRDTSALVEIDLDGKPLREIAHDPHFDLGGVATHPRTREIQAVSWQKDRKHRLFLDDELGEDWRRASEIDEGDMSIVSRTLDDRHWVVAFMRDDGPVRYHVHERSESASTHLFSHRPELEGLPLRPMRAMKFTARDGLEIHGYLTEPQREGEEAPPMVLVPHGGPWSRDTWGLDPVAQWLANRGYAVLQVNFRGSTGYGKRFLHAGDKEWGRAMQNDLTDAVAWAVAEGVADPARVAIMGGSYGGYAALAGICFTPELYAAAVDIVGPSSLFTLMSSIPPYWEPLKRKMVLQVGDPESEESMLRERSPLFHVDRIRTPLLIGQGANDPRVRQQESEQIVEAMRAKGKDVVYVLFEDEGHGFVRPENRLQFYGIVEEFLAQRLGGQSEPLPEDGHGGGGIVG